MHSRADFIVSYKNLFPALSLNLEFEFGYSTGLEMATPGRGPRHPPGPPPHDGGWGRGIYYPKPRGTGDFFKNTPGVFGGFYVIKTAVFIEILLKKIFFVPLRIVITSLLGVNTSLFYNM